MGKSKRRTPPKGSRPQDLRVEDYDQAWQQFQAGLSSKTVAETLALSTAQVKYLYNHGLKIGEIELPSFQRRLAEELSEIAESANETGKKIAGLASRVLQRAMRNADDATLVIAMIIRNRREVIAAELEKPVEDRDPAKMEFTESELATLRTLRLYQDTTKAALGFQLVFGHHAGAHRALVAAERLVNTQRGRSGGLEEESGTLPAAFQLQGEVAGEAAAVRFKEEIMGSMSTWTTEQLRHFALTGEEPSANQPKDEEQPSEVIDVEYDEG